ncbi:VWA domain-containing protein [Niveispirillum sp. BGYR6]|uniref:VWA domain-containing protein n=1 Tax=Niveispirillum sp. BGYR6 TaxID=2971249 RepID=UPI0022B98F9E|nr:VWA domain-containing protein [Niveispirillum sp. BGYR6]MDG5496030.1 VWA domain-containing protein [Niveispirillum sp. BGYR6]
MKALTQGGNTAIPASHTRVTVGWAPARIGNLDVDASAFLIKADGKVQSDDDMIFYNQPASRDGSVKLADGRFTIDLGQVQPDVVRIAFAITIHEAEGTGHSFAEASAAFIEVENVARYDAATAGMSETALIIGELYRRGGEWKVKAVGQGFVGGLAPLARHFGIVVDEAPIPPPVPDATPLSKAGASRVSLEKRLVNLEKKDQQLVSLIKKVQVSLEKKRLVTDRAKVALVLDISGSMRSLYRSGKVQHFVERAMAIAYRFDDDGEIDVFLFGARDHHYGSLNVDTYRGFVPAMLGQYNLEGGTRYGQVMRRIRAFYASQSDWGQMPVYVMFLTDGGTEDRALSEKMIVEASREPIHWSFIAIGERPAGGLLERGKKSGRLPRGFDFLAYLDDMPGRLVDNANFFAVDDPSKPSDEEIFELLMEEFPSWQEAAHEAGLFRG